MVAIPVRKMGFEFPADMPLMFVEGKPELAFYAVGISFLLPYLEPYLIRTMRKARPLLNDPQLAADLDRFVGQEGQHYRQHMRFNEHFRGAGFDELEAMEQQISADYRRFSAEEPLKFNLAYAEGFEALTTVMARTFARQDKTGWHPGALDLFQWHLVEELEHRCVAFDVYEHVVGDYLYRVRTGFFAQRHLLLFMHRAMLAMLHADAECFASWGGEAAHRERMKELRTMFLEQIAGPWLRTFSPWYTPHAIELSAEVRALSERYSTMAVSVK